MREQMAIGLCGLFLLTACQPTPADAPAALTLIDSVRIQESESLFVGRPNAIAIGPNGAVFVSDIADRKILRVARAGDSVVLVAGRGGGPGEVSSPTSLAIVGDTVLAVQNGGRKRIEWYDLASLRYRQTLRITSPAASLTSGDGALLFGSLVPDSGTAFAELIDSLGALQRGGTVPDIYRRSPPVAQAFGALEVAKDGDAILGLFEVSNTLYRWPRRSGASDSIVLTVTTRRGARPDHIEELLRDPSKAATLAFQWSIPMLVAPLSAERALVVFHDPTLVKDQYRGPSFVQLVDWRAHRSCAELALPVPADTPPRYAMRGDTLVAVVQHPSGEDGVSSWIVRWRIGASRC
ncbi:MAG: hypothetical protein IT353_24345 [Gemmatimonadaceae bacterium]|nr:hypothetical protein [Gemmatimonadaceae bacterium]